MLWITIKIDRQCVRFLNYNWIFTNYWIQFHLTCIFSQFSVNFVSIFRLFLSHLTMLIRQFMQCTFRSCQFETAQHTLALPNHGVSSSVFFFFWFIHSFFLCLSVYRSFFYECTFFQYTPSLDLNNQRNVNTNAHMPSV